MSGRTRSQNRSKGRSRSRGMMGGSQAVAASTGGGAAGWALSNFGNGDQQWWNTFGPKSLGIENGNLLPTVVGAPAVLPGMTPQGQNVGAYTLKSLMSGGRRRKGMKRTKGGMGMLETAAVPLTLLAIQQSYGTRRKGTRRGSRRRSSRRRGSRRR
jgi:hypothetical protein